MQGGLARTGIVFGVAAFLTALAWLGLQAQDKKAVDAAVA